MLGDRVRRLRMAQGLSLSALADRMGNAITRQALSKYETGKAHPSPQNLVALAHALGVKASELVAESHYSVEVIGSRKLSSLPTKEQARLESAVTLELERRMGLMDALGMPMNLGIEPHSARVRSLDEAEGAAISLRDEWNLGKNPISSLVETLEYHRVHVIEVEAGRGFDGMSAIGRDESNEPKAVAVAVRPEMAGERQRMNLAHELGHLVQEIGGSVDEEEAASRFAGAFLAPADSLVDEVGRSRTRIEPVELLALKEKWGMSVQALLYRLHDLDVISQRHYKDWCMRINMWKWRTHEPEEMSAETSTWLTRNVSRALAEGIVAHEDVAEYVTQGSPAMMPPIFDRRAIMALSVDERRTLLEEQAASIEAHYGIPADDWQAGDFDDG